MRATSPSSEPPASDRYQVVSEANRRCYGRPGAAEEHDKTHFLGVRDLEGRYTDLKRAPDVLGHPARPRASAVAACGGPGPGGLSVTIFDPVKPTRAEKVLLEPVRLLDRALSEPGKVLGGVGRVVRRVFRGGSRYKHEHVGDMTLTDDNVGTIAEFHGDEGIDDVALAREIERTGKLRVLHHDRHRQPWGILMPYARMLLRKPTKFRFLLQNAETG